MHVDEFGMGLVFDRKLYMEEALGTSDAVNVVFQLSICQEFPEHKDSKFLNDTFNLLNPNFF